MFKLKWWLQFLRIYNGLSLITDLDWSEPDSVISTDACLKGLGGINFITIRVITKLPNSEQSYKGKVKTHNYINRQNQSTTGKL